MVLKDTLCSVAHSEVRATNFEVFSLRMLWQQCYPLAKAS